MQFASYKNSHVEVKYSTGNLVDNIVRTMVSDGSWIYHSDPLISYVNVYQKVL